MSKKCTCVCKTTKKGQFGATKLKGAASPTTDLLIDNQDQSFTLNGVDAAGATVDIGDLATVTATSSNTAAITVDPATGMTVQGHAVAPGDATLTFVATFNDGSIGPFTVDLPVTVSAGPVSGLVVTPGIPTVRP